MIDNRGLGHRLLLGSGREQSAVAWRRLFAGGRLRAGSISPTEALEATLDAIGASESMPSATWTWRPPGGRGAADTSLPFGGVPLGIKELEKVEGWPYTEASLVLKDRIADHDSTQITRLRAAGAVLAGQTIGVGVRRGQLHVDKDLRGHPQPVGSRTHSWRVLGRIGGRGGRRPYPAGQRR